MLYHWNRFSCFVTGLRLCEVNMLASCPFLKCPLWLCPLAQSPPLPYFTLTAQHNSTYWSRRSSISLCVATRIESHLEELKAMLYWMLSHAFSHSFWLLKMVPFPVLAAKHGVAFPLLWTQQGNWGRPVYTSREALAGLFHSKCKFQSLPHLLKGKKKGFCASATSVDFWWRK